MLVILSSSIAKTYRIFHAVQVSGNLSYHHELYIQPQIIVAYERDPEISLNHELKLQINEFCDNFWSKKKSPPYFLKPWSRQSRLKICDLKELYLVFLNAT